MQVIYYLFTGSQCVCSVCVPACCDLRPNWIGVLRVDPAFCTPHECANSMDHRHNTCLSHFVGEHENEKPKVCQPPRCARFNGLKYQRPNTR